MRRPSTTPKVIKNYKYAAYSQGELPEEIWSQAREMNALWNAMLEAREKFLSEISEIRDQNKENVEKETIRTPISEPEKSKWSEYDRALVEISTSKEWKEKLNWEAREFVLENFRAASKRAFKNKGQLRRKSSFLERIVIPHRFTRGGLEIAKIFTGWGKKLRLNPLPQEVFQNNEWQSRRARLTQGIYGFGNNNAPIPIRVLFHRELPPLALIKITLLNGLFDNLTRRWKWSLIITCQTEPVEEIKPFKPIAALDLGYRRIGDYLRVGYLADTSGNQFELRLPLLEKPSRRLLNSLKAVNNARQHQDLPPLEIENFFPVSILDAWEWKSKNDLFLEEIKEKIKPLIESKDFDLAGEINSAEIKQILDNLTRVRRTGLLKLWKLTLEAENQYLKEMHGLLEAWKQRDLETLKKIKTTQTHLINKRNKQYENIALWLKTNYSYLVCEKDISLKQIAEQAPRISLNSKEVAIKKGAKFRNFASPSFLLRKLKEHDTNEWLITAETTDSTLKCCHCGLICETTSNLTIICPDGHETDQDYQACRNFLSGLPDHLIYDRKKTYPTIPPHLKNLIVPV